MDSFATKAGTVRADTSRNLLLIQGTGAERRTAVDTALSFDVDWMRGQSVGIFPITSGPPEPIIAELEKIVDSGENGLSQNVIKFQPVARLNAIMVVTKQAGHAAHRRDLDQAARPHRHRANHRPRLSGEIRRCATDRARADRDVPRRFGLVEPARQRRQPDRAGIRPSRRRRAPTACRSPPTVPHPWAVSPPVAALALERQNTVLGGGHSDRLRRRSEPPTPAAMRPRSTAGRGATGGNGQPVLQDVRITPDTVNNTLLIYADQANYRIIEVDAASRSISRSCRSRSTRPSPRSRSTTN